jgi:predicted methyltransferase
MNTYVSLMYELKKNGKVFTSKFVGTGPSSYEKRIYQAAVSQRLRNTGLDRCPVFWLMTTCCSLANGQQRFVRTHYLHLQG